MNIVILLMLQFLFDYKTKVRALITNGKNSKIQIDNIEVM